MKKFAYIYREDANNGMKFVCIGDTKEEAEAKVVKLLGGKIKIEWTEFIRPDPASGGSLWYGVIKG
jgi:hypothetical protein